MLKDYRIAPKTGSNPGHVVILLHGLGDSGSGGLLSIASLWQPSLPDTEFLCPDAPFPFPGMPGARQWFDLTNRSPQLMLQGVQTAAPYLNEYIDHVLSARGLASSKLALVGFSQGTMMSLYVGPRRKEPVAGIIGYSGMLIGAETLAAEKKSSPPILLIHGTDDDIVPFTAMGAAEAGLKNAGLTVSSITCPGVTHGVDDNGIIEGLKFLKKTLV